MTPDEFREAYAEAQNRLGNHLQALANLSGILAELPSTFNTLVESTQADYMRMNAVINEFLDTQELS